MKLFSTFIVSCLFTVVSIAAEFSVTPEQLIAEINIRKTKVLEFKQLHDYGKEHGIRIWVAGGSAAGLAHYVKDDLENEFLKSHGEEPLYFEGRFGYNYFDIYRSTQDCDVIINGDEAQAQELEAFIREKFGHLQGSKEVFEVRLLDKPRGSGAGQKDALINNPDFLDQHTDSHSTGMVELTQPPVEESAVRDLFDWNNQKNHKFISDVIDNQLSYYFSEKHNSTKRFLIGINPPILSVLRYYTKLFQYGLKPRKEDEKYLVKFIKEFNPQDPAWNESYVNKQINKNGIKMIRHAQDMEFAINTVERVGLKDKLLKFVSQGEEQVRLWVNKEPLRSYPLASKPGRTAKELGITIVAHETRDFLTYESITMSRRGVPNVFISRRGFDGEMAVYGDGFYTKMGEEGAVGSGWTIRYTVDPNAIEGGDFIYEETQGYIIFKNREVLKVIDESVEIGPVEYFKMLTSQELKNSDRGVWQKIGLKVKSEMGNLSSDQLDKIVNIIKAEIDQKAPKWIVIEKWYEMDVSEKIVLMGPVEFFRCLSRKDGVNQKALFAKIASKIKEKMNNISKEELDQILAMVKKELYMSDIGFAFLVESQWNFLRAWFELERSIDYPEIVERLVENGNYGKQIAKVILSQPHWAQYERSGEFLETILKKGKRDDATVIVRYVLSQPSWAQHPRGAEMLSIILERRNYDYEILVDVLSQPHWAQHERGAEFLAIIIERNGYDWPIFGDIFSEPCWMQHDFAAEYWNAVLDKGVVSWAKIVEDVLSNPEWTQNSKGVALLEKIILIGRIDEDINKFVLSNSTWANQPRLIKLCDGKEVNAHNIREGLEREIQQNKQDCSQSFM